MIFLSAGHFNQDPGAVGNGYVERDLTIELRGLVLGEIQKLGGSVVLDDDRESLAKYISRIKPGFGSVVCELHFNAAGSASATGAEVLYPQSGSLLSIDLAKELTLAISSTLGIVSRGAKSESESHRGRLAILRTAAGISCLPEICFISSKSDMVAYQNNKKVLAKRIAEILVKYDKVK